MNIHTGKQPGTGKPRKALWAILVFATFALCAAALPIRSLWRPWGADPDGIVPEVLTRAGWDDLRLLSRLGDAEASYELARRLEAGHGVERDAAAAGYLYQVAEEQGIDLPQSVIDRLHL